MTGRREQIIQAASEIVMTRGVAALSVRNVATHAGIGASTLRHYFPTQRDLYDAALGHSFDAHLDDRRITDTTVPPADRLTECLAQMLPQGETDRPVLEHWFAMHAHAIGAGRTDAGALLLETLSRRARARVDQWCTVLHTEGALHEDHARTVTTVLAVVDGLSLALLVPGGTLTVTDARETLRGVVGHLVRPAERT